MDAKLVRELFNYDPETGILTWAVDRSNKVKAGMEAGCVGGKGYLVLGCNGKTYQTSNIIWLWWYGEWPKNQVDHIDRSKMNNRIKNLRDLTSLENMQNHAHSRSDSTIGVRGVSRNKSGFVARLMVAGVRRNLGTYSTVVEAEQAYERARAESCPYAP